MLTNIIPNAVKPSVSHFPPFSYRDANNSCGPRSTGIIKMEYPLVFSDSVLMGLISRRSVFTVYISELFKENY